MTDKAVQYYLDKDKLIDIRVDHWDNGKMYVSVYNDRNDKSVAFQTTKDKLLGLADFLIKNLENK
jgi:Rod binding domain-containing protein